MKDLQNKSGVHFEILEGWGESIPLEEPSVDVAIARQVLHHAGDLQKMCDEIYRVLKPGGLFLALREHVISKDSDRETVLFKHPMHLLTGEENAYTLKYYIKCIKTAGFSKIRKYGFWESVLNYAPVKKNDIRDEIVKSLYRRVPLEGVIRKFLDIVGMQSLMQWAMTRASNVPGRLYSFIAEK